MDISRVTRNKLELRTQRVALADVVQGAVESSRPVIEQFGHQLSVTLPPEPVYLNADVVRLAQVFMNLLTNAAKYTDQKGHISLTANRENGEVVVSVKDSGIGIPADKLPRLFDMFFQVDRTLERAQGGLGIGLSLVRRLVDLHGGTVEARSEGWRKGSEFIVRLPVFTCEHSIEEDKYVESDDGSRTKRRIVVADDNTDSAKSLAMLLRVSGHDVHLAHDGLAAVKLVEEVRPDLVLLDIGMPKLNGYEACRQIRKTAWGKDIALVALTGWGQDEDRHQTAEAGFDEHIVKPVEYASLLKLLATR
jgi:CheY-like chemotaxis protein/two-component sensor histidine kinase